MPVLQNISQLATCPPGKTQQDAGLVRNAALAWNGEEITWTGPHQDLPDQFRSEPVTDCGGRLVVPGLVDCHTHLCFGGWRGDEFEMRLRGASYLEIARSGGGISSTVAATRGASMGSLERRARSHLDAMLRLGITTVECKSGYGLDLENELKQLEVYRRLASQHCMTLVPTFLGAHVVPREFEQDRAAYVRLLCDELIPIVARRQLARFCDIFVEQGAFTLSEARLILESARENGLGIKIHADQLADGSGAKLAAELGAVSAEHLEYVSKEGIQSLSEADVVAVSLPLASLYLRERYMPARQLLAAGTAVAVATDFNPGSAPSFHLPLAMTLACLNQGMSPAEALMGATTVAAKAVGLQTTTGSLLPGYQADFALIDAPDLNHWLYHFRDNACIGVVKKGNWAHRSAAA
ncbi:MAG TPA: imidazolonepropionase [Xanthomonadales bacterium]|nr:imidazolonepropionase [Xanthomonadales bacterium]